MYITMRCTCTLCTHQIKSNINESADEQMKYNTNTIHSGDVGSNTSVGCSQRGDPVLQKLSRNSFNRRQLTLVVRSGYAGHTLTFFFATNKPTRHAGDKLLFREEPVVVADCDRWEVNCIFVAEKK